jgi:hypothetical protein
VSPYFYFHCLDILSPGVFRVSAGVSECENKQDSINDPIDYRSSRILSLSDGEEIWGLIECSRARFDQE